MDTAARIYALKAEDSNASSHNGLGDIEFLISVSAMFDFATAFPSVAHDWLFLVLRACSAPSWFINFIECLYFVNHTFQMSSYGKQFLFNICCGVLQGCPASATLFILCVDPFLHHFELSLVPKDKGMIRACADDIGAALSDFRVLKKNVPCFFARRANCRSDPEARQMQHCSYFHPDQPRGVQLHPEMDWNQHSFVVGFLHRP